MLEIILLTIVGTVVAPFAAGIAGALVVGVAIGITNTLNFFKGD